MAGLSAIAARRHRGAVGLTPSYRFQLEQAVRALPRPPAEQYAELFQHGSLRVGLYAPRIRDPQGPHAQDEVYVVMAGTGWFVNGSRRDRFAPGDVLFVPAGTPHRFEEFGDDLETWVIFYGPQGGERGERDG